MTKLDELERLYDASLAEDYVESASVWAWAATMYDAFPAILAAMREADALWRECDKLPHQDWMMQPWHQNWCDAVSVAEKTLAALENPDADKS